MRNYGYIHIELEEKSNNKSKTEENQKIYRKTRVRNFGCIRIESEEKLKELVEKLDCWTADTFTLSRKKIKV